MSRTTKIERARAINHGPNLAQKTDLDKPVRRHKDVDLLQTGNTVRDRNGNTIPEIIDNGGNRYGNNRHMWAKVKVHKRRQERRRLSGEE